MSTRRRGTKTRSFGAGVRESHDASAYYARQLMPLGVNAELDPEPRPEKPFPKEARNRIFLKSSERMDDLPERCVHLMVTSPPYNVGKEYDADLSMDEYLNLIAKVMRETYRVLVDGGRACVNVANIGRKPYIPLHAYVIQIAAKIGFFMRGEIIWDKGMSGSSTAWGSWRSPSNPTLRDTHEYILVFQKPPFGRRAAERRTPTILREAFLEFTKSTWHIPPASAKRAGHPAPFPVQLPRRLIDLYTFSGEVVLDPFMGTGATALAAHGSLRTFVGYEIEPSYVEVANRRLKETKTVLDYEQIAESHYRVVSKRLSNATLKRYFDDCFNDAISQSGLYPAWVCMQCPPSSNGAVRYGIKPNTCPVCGTDRVFEVATFQGRAPVVGSTFRAAVQVLMRFQFELELMSTSPSTTTHGLGASLEIAIEAKGSPLSYNSPDGTVFNPHRPGLMRSDTRKKTLANARQYKLANASGTFFVVTNAMPTQWVEKRPDGVDGIFDLTDPRDVERFVSEVDARLNRMR